MRSIAPLLVALLFLTSESVEAADTQAPSLVDLTISPSSADVSQGDIALDVALSFSDDLSGLDWGQFRILSPSSVFIALTVLGEDKLLEGDDLNGKYLFSIVVPQYTQAGELKYDLKIRDKVGNWLDLVYDDLVNLGLGGKVVVVNENEDLLAPEVTSITADPSLIDVNRNAASVDFDLVFTDSKSGIDRGQFRIFSPAGNFLTLMPLGLDKLAQGDANAGVLRVSLQVPAFTPSGALIFDYDLTDKVGNNLEGDSSSWEVSVVLDQDSDSDSVGDNFDNCPALANADQLNSDEDSEGDACDLDDDNDGFTDEEELADGTNPLSRFSCRSGCFSFDIDENSEAKALTDGLLVIRHLFGFTGDALATGAISTDAIRDRAEDISALLADADSELDIDGNGESKALSDGLLLIRYLFGFTGDALTVGAIGEGATRDTSEAIEAYISDRVPASE